MSILDEIAACAACGTERSGLALDGRQVCGTHVNRYEHHLERRDRFAMAALTGLLSHGLPMHPDEAATKSWSRADAMIAAGEQK